MGRKSKLPLILDALRSSTAKARGLTQREIQDRAGISAGCVNEWIARLHRDRAVYVASWKTDVGGSKGAPFQARYRIGDCPDVPKPPPMTRAEVARRYRARALESGLIEDIRAKGRAIWWSKQPARRDPLASALFGHPPAANDSSSQEVA